MSKNGDKETQFGLFDGKYNGQYSGTGSVEISEIFAAQGAFFFGTDRFDGVEVWSYLVELIFIWLFCLQQIRFDDVFVGIATWKLKIPVRNLEGIYFHEPDVPKVMKRHGDVISAQGFKDVTLLRQLWDDHYSLMMRLVSLLQFLSELID